MLKVNWILINYHNLTIGIIEIFVRNTLIHIDLAFNVFLISKVNLKSILVDLIHKIKKIINNCQISHFILMIDVIPIIIEKRKHLR